MVLLAWALSGYLEFTFVCGSGSFEVRIEEGCLVVSNCEAVGNYWYVSDYRGRWRGWTWGFQIMRGSWGVTAVPLWLPFSMLSVPGALGWRESFAQRRWARSASACTGCGYDRRGLAVEVKCPECGAAAAGE
jgi:hypothetical protein